MFMLFNGYYVDLHNNDTEGIDHESQCVPL